MSVAVQPVLRELKCLLARPIRNLQTSLEYFEPDNIAREVPRGAPFDLCGTVELEGNGRSQDR